jgi:hypothetical protein
MIFAALLIAMAALAVSMPAPAHAFISKPECLSLLKLEAFADETKLSADDRAALAKARDMAAEESRNAGLARPIPPTIYNFNGLFLAINPGLDKSAPFGLRSLIVALSVDGMVRSTAHPVRSPNYEFGFIGNPSNVMTFLTFYGNTRLRIVLTARNNITEKVDFATEPPAAGETIAPCVP